MCENKSMNIEKFVCSNGAQIWLQDGDLGREDGPTIEYPDGTKVWYQHGKIHREDGPAVEYPDGSKEWFIRGEFRGFEMG